MDLINTLPILQIHVLAVFTTLTLVAVADAHGLLWILGKIKTLPSGRMDFFHKATWIGLTIIITAGFFMFLNESSYLLSLPVFKLKMFFVLCLIINAFVIGAHMMTATTRTFSSLSLKEKMPLFISGGVSSISWIGAFILADFL